MGIDVARLGVKSIDGHVHKKLTQVVNSEALWEKEMETV